MAKVAFPYRANRASGLVILFCMLPLFAIAVGATLRDPAQPINWIALMVFGGLAAFGAALVRGSRLPPRQIIIGSEGIRIPSLVRRSGGTYICYANIRRVIWFPKYIVIWHAGGLCIVTRASLENGAAYASLNDHLKHSVQNAKSG